MTSPHLAFAALTALFTLTACGRSSTERARPDTAGFLNSDRFGPPPELSVTERIPGGLPPAPPVLGGIAPLPTATPDVLDPADTAPAPSDTTPDADLPTPTLIADPDLLPPAVLELLARPTSERDRQASDRLTSDAHRALQRLAFDDARAAFTTALERWPASPKAHSGLAAALTLAHEPDLALYELAQLAWLARRDPDAAAALDRARVQVDFESIREDPRFRRLTGATAITVVWVRSDDDRLARTEARRLARLLKDANWNATAATTPWPANDLAPTVPTLRLRAGDVIAAEVAPALRALLLSDAALEPDSAAWPIIEGLLPTAGAPVVLVLPAPQPADPSADPGSTPEWPLPDPSLLPGLVPPDPPAPLPGTLNPEPKPVDPDPQPSALPAHPPANPPRHLANLSGLSDLIDRPLSSEVTTPTGTTLHALTLRESGFFTWDITEPTGTIRRRSGRWRDSGTGALELLYRETRETPAPRGGQAPQVTLHDSQRASLGFSFDDGNFILDGRTFALTPTP